MLKQTAPLTIALLISLSGDLQAQPAPSNPMIFSAPPPPSTGQPGRRSDAGSRGCGGDESSNSSESPSSLLALVPTQKTASATVVFGKTAADHPTFWFYVPHQSSLTATFVLQDQDGNSIYQSDVTLPQTVGIFSVTLPATVAPLETGKLYHWFFKLYCRSISPPSSFVDGWIQRESLPSNLAQQLQTATQPQRVRLYAASGFWFDALTTAARLHQTTPADAAWAELLKAIGLENVAAEAIVMP